jgi:hypothetical protein
VRQLHDSIGKPNEIGQLRLPPLAELEIASVDRDIEPVFRESIDKCIGSIRVAPRVRDEDFELVVHCRASNRHAPPKSSLMGGGSIKWRHTIL